MTGIALLIAPFALLGAAAPAAAQHAGDRHDHAAGEAPAAESAGPSMAVTPASIAAEHHELHETLARASAEGGEHGRAAAELERALAPHFQREEEIATPPLGLLPALAGGKTGKEMRSVLPMTEALERELPKMLREHELIRQAVGKFRAAAAGGGRDDYVRFADALAAHARQEEEILYPAAILVGRYIALTAPR